MRGATSSSKKAPGAKGFWLAVLCAVAAATLTSPVYADDDDDRGRRWSHERRHERWGHDHHRRHDRWERRHSHARRWEPHRRARHCHDRRHHHSVHYHVLARDYYDHYYPRYRYYGPAPIDASASVIVTLPLF